MDIFHNPNFDFLGKKRPFIIVSLVLIAVGIASLVAKGGPRYGIDFRGGALMYVKFVEQPPVQEIRSALSARIPGEITVQNLTDSQEVVIGTELQDEAQLTEARAQMIQVLNETFGDRSGKLDFNNVGAETLIDYLRTPLQAAGVAMPEADLRALAERLQQRKINRGGLVANINELSDVEGVTPQILSVLNAELVAAPFTVRQVEIVGPKVGADLRRQAMLATLYALGGMLVYIAFRFEWIYGVAAVIAVAHDVMITIGFFSLFEKEISLTVVAGLLTLVGYSMNDTIVIFDRVRENLKIMRREKLESLINISVNQTLSRTVLTSGLTFVTVLALLLFGGPVINAFAFALTVGILVGTYSSVFIASPIVLFWHNYVEGRKRRAVAVPAVSGKEPVRKRREAGRLT
jgi:preprotein translocase subunit SecF